MRRLVCRGMEFELGHEKEKSQELWESKSTEFHLEIMITFERDVNETI